MVTHKGGRFAVGFIFDTTFAQVVLLQKKRPDWQRDRLNGIGGQCEPAESPISTMMRECSEESGVRTEALDWTEFAVLRYPGSEVHFFYMANDEAFMTAHARTDEDIIKVGCDPFNSRVSRLVVPNLNYLIPMVKWWDSAASGARLMLPVHLYEEAVTL